MSDSSGPTVQTHSRILLIEAQTVELRQVLRDLLFPEDRRKPMSHEIVLRAAKIRVARCRGNDAESTRRGVRWIVARGIGP
jgi:hypothetical protein